MFERKRIYLCLAHMSDDGAEQRYVKEAFDTNWVVPLGPNVNAFEQELERFVCAGSGFFEAQPTNPVECVQSLTQKHVAKRYMIAEKFLPLHHES
jgi:hypothetical protein